MHLPLENTYRDLGEDFSTLVQPEGSPAPSLIRINTALAKNLGLSPDELRSDKGLAIFSGNQIPANTTPISQVYAGHQFGGFNPRLGDGRAMLLGELIDEQGARKDIQLKGSGRTPFSRNGDGLSALGPVLREYIVSEAMHAYGIPTTRALAAVATGGQVQREHMEPGGIFTRVASSHLRVGTFQYFTAQREIENISLLLDYSIQRHYPQAASSENPAAAFLCCVVKAQARLIAQWLPLGFIHGVMNTDNCTISGETIDYGPCAFMDDFHPDCVFSYIDRNARYAWSNQPTIGHWNMTRLAETLLPLLDKDLEKSKTIAREALDQFLPTFQSIYTDTFRTKLGLSPKLNEKQTTSFIKETLGMLAQQHVDFTLFFSQLSYAETNSEQQIISELLANPSAFKPWLDKWKTMPKSPDYPFTMRRINPVLIPRNHRIEQAIQSAYSDDYQPFHRLVDGLKKPFEQNSDYLDLQAAPEPHEIVKNTFCGT